MRLKKPLMAILVAVQMLPAFAAHGHDDSGRDRLQNERERQHKFIRQGLKSGALTRREADILQREQRELRQLERELREDKRLKPWERRYLLGRSDELSEHIRALAHNELYRQHRPRKKSHEHHYDDQRGHNDREVGKGDDVLLWATLGIMGVVLVEQLND